jgi:hypothetical protein
MDLKKGADAPHRKMFQTVVVAAGAEIIVPRQRPEEDRGQPQLEDEELAMIRRSEERRSGRQLNPLQIPSIR